MHRRKCIAISAAALLAGGYFAFAQTTPAPATTATAPAAPARRAPSPSGTAATQVCGTWSAPDKDGNQRYSDGKWIEVV